MSCHVMSCHVMSCHVMSCHVMSCHVKIVDTLLGTLQSFFEFFAGFSTNFSVLSHKNKKNDVEFQRQMNREGEV